MKSLVLPLLFPLALFPVLPVSARESGPVSDAYGRPLFDARSQPLFYDSPGAPVETGKAPMAAPADVSAKAGEPWTIAANPGGSPFWSYGVYGTQIGQAGLVPVEGEHGTELFISATANGGFGGNHFWYVLGYDPSTKGYQQMHVQTPYPSIDGAYYGPEMARMTSAHVTGGTDRELVVGLEDGRFFYHSLADFKEIAAFRPVTSLSDFCPADLTGDGVAELIVLTGSGLRVFDAAGQALWNVQGPTGTDVVVAQMDGDPSLEIATTSGHVVDVGTRAIQWTRSGGFGANLRTADIDGDGRDELIAANAWYDIYAYDVDTQATKWSYRAGLDISAIEIGNVDADPAPELIYGDGQHGSVHVLTLGAGTPVEEWKIANPDSGIPRIAVADADEDGVAELIWSGGSNTTGEDRLNIVDPFTRLWEWQSFHLDGPFISPVTGDVTGDGKPELVTASRESRSGYGSGRILVFDPETLALLGISGPIARDYSWTGLRDLKLRDIDGDGRQEIVIAADWLYDGIVEIYGFTDAREFELKWETADRADGSPFTQVEVLDVDGDGDLEVVTANDRAHSGSEGTYVRVFDLATRSQEWRSPNLDGSWGGVNSMGVADVDGDGSPEAVVAVPEEGIFIFDLRSRLHELTIPGDFRSVAVGNGGFSAGLGNGEIKRYLPDGAGAYTESASWKASAEPILGLTPGLGQSLWVVTGKRIYLWPDAVAPIWSSDSLATPAGRVAFHEAEDGMEMYAAFSHAIGGFKIGGDADFSVVSLESEGSLEEGSEGEATLTFARNKTSDADTTVVFQVDGAAEVDKDFTIAGADALGDGRWSVVIPAGWLSQSVTLGVLQDASAEGTEIIRAEIRSAHGYFQGSPMMAMLSISDDEPVISVVAGDATADEAVSGRMPDKGTFTLTRTGDLSRPLQVHFRMEGSADMGADYRKLKTSVTFKKGRDVMVVNVVPVSDHKAEDDESVMLRLLPTIGYRISETEPVASVTILDGEPTVSVAGVSGFNKAMAVKLLRSGGNPKPVAVTLLITRQEADGRVQSSQRRVKFKAGAQTAQYLVSPGKKAAGPAEVWVEILDDGSFHAGGSLSASFRLPGPAR